MRSNSKTIMIVDDEPLNHDLMEQILKDSYEVVSSMSGETCLGQLKDITPAAILLDIMMPGIDGYEVCRSIKANSAWKEIPIIFVSADDSLESRLKGYEHGAEAYFIKPINKVKLLEKVTAVLDYQEAREQQLKNTEQANKVAMQAMTTSSDLGKVLRFVQSSFTAANYDVLSKMLFETIKLFDLQACIQIRTDSNVINISQDGMSSPLEASILHYACNKGRIIDSASKSIFNHRHISIMIKNMPLDNEIRYGNIKDNICYLLEGAEARIIALQSELQLKQKKTLLTQLIREANHTMENINNDLHVLRLEGAAIVEDMLEKITDLVPQLALQEAEENQLLTITETGVEQTMALYKRGIRVDERFIRLIEQLFHAIDDEDREETPIVKSYG